MLSPQEQIRLRREAVRRLKWLSFDDSAAIRCQAIEALSDVAAEQAVADFQHHLGDEYWGVRFEACVALGRMRHDRSRPLLAARLDDPHPAVQAAAIYALHRMGDSSHTSKLADLLLRNEQPLVRRVTAQLLGRLQEPGSIKLLRRALRDRDEAVRWEATVAMARLGDSKALQELVFFANSGFSDKQTFALLELALMEDPRCLELFRYRLKEGPYRETRLAAARGLGRLGYRDGLALALKLLRFDKPDLSPRVVKNDPPGQQIARVRSMAAHALGAIGDPSALAALARAMRSGDKAVQVAAAKAIVRIVNRQLGPTRQLAPPMLARQ